MQLMTGQTFQELRLDEGETVIDRLTRPEMDQLEEIRRFDTKKADVNALVVKAILATNLVGDEDERESLDEMMDFALKLSEFNDLVWDQFWHTVLCARDERPTPSKIFAIRVDASRRERPLVIASVPVSEF